VHGSEVADQVADAPLGNPRHRDVEATADRGETRRQLLGDDPEALALLDDGLDAPLAQRVADEEGHAVMVPDVALAIGVR
jgi:hypothetical protein